VGKYLFMQMNATKLIDAAFEGGKAAMAVL